MHLTALDDAAWAGPWRRVRVGEKVALSLGLVLTALLTPSWPGSVLVATASVALTCGPARIPPRARSDGPREEPREPPADPLDPLDPPPRP